MSTVEHARYLPAKIQPWHHERLAIVYVRQSSPQQVLQHRESTELQYDLQAMAVAWGWSAQRILVIDEDQGHSGQTARGRAGFQRLLTEVNLNHVGLILGLEMSRLARSNKDWHDLLERCAVFETLLADQDGLYNPTDYNDRLLLGLKGAMSEAELHIMLKRMNQGRLNKARRGDLFYHPPIGYIRSPAGELVIDPDEQVQSVVRLIFDTFDELGSVAGLLRRLVRQDVRIGMRPCGGRDRGQLQWRRPCRPTLNRMLHHPFYAGTYVHGLRKIDHRRQSPGHRSSGRVVVPALQWEVMIPDRLPAYITWDRYLENQRRMAENRSRSEALGAPRRGSSLLGGLLFCGRCGRRMLVAYGGRSNHLRYNCHSELLEHGASRCQSLGGRLLDDLVGRQVLRALEPAAMELSLAAAMDLRQERQALHDHWKQRLERATQEADRAARQYHATEPENRLVARELERRWERALAERRQLEEDYDRFVDRQPPSLTEADMASIRAMATDLPTLWEAASTTPQDRQAVIRHLVERIVVTVLGRSELVEVTIHWAGGATSRHEGLRPIGKYEDLSNFDELRARVVELRREGRTAAQIAELINLEGFHPPRCDRPFSDQMVQVLIGCRFGSEAAPSPDRRALGCHEWWLAGLAEELSMPPLTLHHWVSRGWVRGRQLQGASGHWVLWADEKELDRLRRLRSCRGRRDLRPYPSDLTTPGGGTVSEEPGREEPAPGS
jgi:DNA invertase Pin-like site-specific DNA recombinase